MLFISEVQKCFQEYINNYCNFEKFLPNVGIGNRHLYKDIDNLQLEKIQECNKCKIMKDGFSNFKDGKSKNYEKLQQDVTKLEYEVQSFLDSLRSRRSEVS